MQLGARTRQRQQHGAIAVLRRGALAAKVLRLYNPGVVKHDAVRFGDARLEHQVDILSLARRKRRLALRKQPCQARELVALSRDELHSTRALSTREAAPSTVVTVPFSNTRAAQLVQMCLVLQ
jgi:hypothetical protein